MEVIKLPRPARGVSRMNRAQEQAIIRAAQNVVSLEKRVFGGEQPTAPYAKLVEARKEMRRAVEDAET